MADNIKMKYEEFVEKVKEKAHEEMGYPLGKMTFYPEGFTSEDPIMIEWIRDSNRRYMGKADTTLLTDYLVLEEEEPGIGSFQHRIAIRKLYEDALEKGFEAAFRDIGQLQKNIDKTKVDRNRLDVRSSYDYELIREQLIVRPLNYSLHIRDLNGCVYWKISDFVLALYQVLGDENNSLVTSKIRRDEIEKWGMKGQEEKIIQDALTNTARLYPPCVYDQRTGCEEDFLKKEFSRKDITFQFCANKIMLSTFKTTNGAVALFYPGVIEKMMKIMGGSFLAVFMNINDVLIFDKDDQMAYHFTQIAKEAGPIGEMLSGKMYLCNENGVHAGFAVSVYENEK